MKTRKFMLVGIVLAAVVTSGVVLHGAGSATADPSEVKDKAAKFAKSGKVELEEQSEGTFAGLRGLGQYKDTLTGDDYLWDVKGGFIRRYANSTSYENRSQGRQVSEDKARKIAEQWIAKCYDGASIEGMRVTCTPKDEGDEGYGEWAVEFRRFAGDIPTFDHFLVVLDAGTGEVLFVEQEIGVLTESLEPSVSREQAVAIAAAEMAVPEACCVDVHLEVVRTLDAEQVLVWWVGITTGTAETGGSATVIIDAHTGSVLDSGTSW